MSWPVPLCPHPDFLRSLPVPPDPSDEVKKAMHSIGLAKVHPVLTRSKLPIKQINFDDLGRPVSCTCGNCRVCRQRAWFRVNGGNRNKKRRNATEEQRQLRRESHRKWKAKQVHGVNERKMKSDLS